MWLCLEKVTKLKLLAIGSSVVLIIAGILIMPSFFQMTDFSSNVMMIFAYLMLATLIILVMINLGKMLYNTLKEEKLKKEEIKKES